MYELRKHSDRLEAAAVRLSRFQKSQKPNGDMYLNLYVVSDRWQHFFLHRQHFSVITDTVKTAVTAVGTDNASLDTKVAALVPFKVAEWSR